MAAPTTMNWKVNVSDYMGHKYEQYKAKLYGLALSKPSEYYELKSTVIEKLNEQIAEHVYEIFFKLLTNGLLPDNSPMKIDGKEIKPCWPGQAATAFSLDASNEIDKIISKCVDIILPASHLEIANLQLKEKSKTLGIE